MRYARAGFTLIELLIVVVIIGILATIAIPKFASSKDKSRLASVRSDLRNLMTSQEAYFFDFNTFADWPTLQAKTNANITVGNSVAITTGSNGYTATVSNASISTGFTKCSVQVGGGAAAGVDGVIICS
jgi:prepilin-type N-terminal cleavage/methylation domain-containing protein